MIRITWALRYVNNLGALWMWIFALCTDSTRKSLGHLTLLATRHNIPHAIILRYLRRSMFVDKFKLRHNEIMNFPESHTFLLVFGFWSGIHSARRKFYSRSIADCVDYTLPFTIANHNEDMRGKHIKGSYFLNIYKEGHLLKRCSSKRPPTPPLATAWALQQRCNDSLNFSDSFKTKLPLIAHTLYPYMQQKNRSTHLMEKRLCITLLVVSRDICFAGFAPITTEENGTSPKSSEMSYYSRELLYELNFVIHMVVKVLHL